MDMAKNDPPKLPDMVMCGDHPSFTKTELNAKVEKPEEKIPEKDITKERIPMSYSRISPSTSHTERALEQRTRAISDHALRLVEARRRVRSLEAVPPSSLVGSGNTALFQAALGSFRWPPYLVGVWVLVLLLTHALHCLVALLDKALPNLKKFCQYLRSWTEEAWRSECEHSRMLPLSLACVTGVLYAAYYGLYVLHSLALWSVEPLCDDKREDETKVTNYVEEVVSTNSTAKS